VIAYLLRCALIKKRLGSDAPRDLADASKVNVFARLAGLGYVHAGDARFRLNALAQNVLRPLAAALGDKPGEMFGLRGQRNHCQSLLSAAKSVYRI
jgi:hypothetical protein